MKWTVESYGMLMKDGKTAGKLEGTKEEVGEVLAILNGLGDCECCGNDIKKEEANPLLCWECEGYVQCEECKEFFDDAMIKMVRPYSDEDFAYCPDCIGEVETWRNAGWYTGALHTDEAWYGGLPWRVARACNWRCFERRR